ncbi:hypothetical protein BXOR1_14690 [Xanthomonas oryzae pv. oryzicola]|nr:hypothetical protein FE36_05350 [Xanthomonas oryzae pv. oryzicola]KOR47111.1 hypothetical protein ADT27_09455 [Xanthomonas oryzae]AKO01579.1 hypothetical protein ACU15_14800 [Xanthomonas oryzae pv. oryzicola]OLK87553.1 hypothetical protein BXOR1_14690 [Xanthomonas oryzae pv. oryzicola]QGH66930.1 hypothetical protein GHV42_16140 [Xanthomonas oryzae pv. oryzicola]
MIMRTRIANHSSVVFVGALSVGLLLFGVFAAVSVQKSVRDRVDGIGVTAIHHGEAGCSVAAALSLLTAGLCNATPSLRAKGVCAEEQARQCRYVGRAARIAQAAPN